MQEIPDEARRFDLGEAGYYFMLVSSDTAFQCFFVGTIGAIFYGSTLLAGVVMMLEGRERFGGIIRCIA